MTDVYPGRAYFICSDARTGSSLLSGALRATCRAGKPFEYFSRNEIERPWLRAEIHVGDDAPFTGFADWRDHILAGGSEGGGVFAASVHYWQLPHCVETFRRKDVDSVVSVLDPLRGFFPELRLVWLRRKDIVAQAVSHYVAITTNVWNSRMGRGVAPGQTDRGAPYDFDKIDWQVKSILAATQGWRDALKGAEAITLPLTYEELAADLPGAVSRVCAFLGVDLEGAPTRAPGIEKQAGPWSIEMGRRYREERQARGMGPVGDEASIGLSEEAGQAVRLEQFAG